MEQNPIIVAVDGFSSCGKSSIAKELARRIGYLYIDSGAMYRAVTLYAIDNQLITAENVVDETALQKAFDQKELQISFAPNSKTQQNDTYLNGTNVEQEIRSMRVASKVSIISALSLVRTELVHQQQLLGREKRIVMDGRDIGTTVFPHAEMKVFVTASTAIRAQRRVDELTKKGDKVSFEEVKNNLEERDHIDQTRADSPLVQASDAVLLDNSTLTIPQQNEWIYQLFCERSTR